MKKFPFDHVVKCDTKEVWLVCDSAIAAMGIGEIVKQCYPGFKARIASKEYLQTLKQKEQ